MGRLGSDAIFPTEDCGIAWDEDLFAQPGSPEQFTTADLETFAKLQHAALEREVADTKAANKLVELVAP